MKNCIKLLTIFLCFLAPFTGWSAPGDTTTVVVHNNVDMTYWGNYDEQTVFPDGNKTYRKVLLTYTLGCASGGCSGWDYTTQIFFRRPTGEFVVDQIDTISTNPLVVDTTWRETIENMELGRVITPYGTYMANGSNGFDNSWTHRYYFDVTDYVHLLKDTANIRAHYSGWSSGFSVTLRFDFIEGTPPRDIMSIQNIYKGSKGYADFNTFESTYFNSKDVNAPANAVGARIFSTITGHGFDNNVSCAEFCPRQYTVNTNGNALASAMIWNDNCGENPIYPQGGTWIYNRAGWCPGSRGDIHEFEWSNFTAGATNTVDFDMQNYTWSGTQQPSYTVNAHVVFYGANNYTNDIELMDVIAPSNHEEHIRENPFCGTPKIRIKNMGSATVTSMTIQYGLNGASTCSYDWTGNIPFLGEEEIELPILEWQGADFNNPTFTATVVSVNGVADEYTNDNSRTTSYTVPDVYDSWAYLLLGVRTNNNPNETSYTLTDASGNVVFQRTQGSMAANTLYKDSLNLSDGCYTLTVKDSGNDGLGWWANTAQGSGAISFYSPFVTFVVVKNFGIDFGSEYSYSFVWNTIDSVQSACNTITSTGQVTEHIDLMHNLYPNPSTGVCNVEIGSSDVQDFTCSVYDVMGNLVHQQLINNTAYQLVQLDLEDQPSGVYLFEVKGSNGSKRVEKFVIAR